MTKSRVQINRSSVTLQRPSGRDPGEVYVNWADKQLGVVDAAKLPMDLVAIRFFSTAANYNPNDYVINGAIIYRAKAGISAGPFDPAVWDVMTAILEAPSDGKIYGRSNATWAETVTKTQYDAQGSAFDSRISGTESKNSTQDGRLDAIDTKNTAQDSSIATINTGQTTQDNRMTTIEGVNTAQDTRLTNIETKNTSQDTAINLRLTDAPSDGNTYGRSNGAWVEAAGGGAGSVGVSGEWTFNTTTAEPPGSGQIRLDNAVQTTATKMWIAETTAPGTDAANMLKYNLVQGAKLYIQDKDTSIQWQTYEIVGPATDKGTYWEAPVLWKEGGTALPGGQRAMLAIIPPAGGSVTIKDTAPANPVTGSLWYESDAGITYIYYDDGNTKQWVQIAGPSPTSSADFIRKTGDTMSGALTLPGDPASGLQAATKAYVDGKTFPAGTVMPFYQAAAPTGWTKLTTENDKALRVVSGTGGVAGGTNAFSTVMAQTVVGNTTLTASQIPSITSSGSASTSAGGNPSNAVPFHTGGFATTIVSSGSGFYGVTTPSAGTSYTGTFSGTASVTSNNTGGGAHNHPITMAIQYIDVILASKN